MMINTERDHVGKTNQRFLYKLEEQWGVALISSNQLENGKLSGCVL